MVRDDVGRVRCITVFGAIVNFGQTGPPIIGFLIRRAFYDPLKPCRHLAVICPEPAQPKVAHTIDRRHDAIVGKGQICAHEPGAAALLQPFLHARDRLPQAVGGTVIAIAAKVWMRMA